MSLIVKTPPAIEPITLAEAKVHLRVDITDDDALIQNLIRAARMNLERIYRRAFIQQSLVLGADYFGMPEYMPTWMYGWPRTMLSYGPTGWMQSIAAVIELRAPLQSVTSVQYTDPSGAVQTLASSNYTVDADSEPGRIVPALGKIWPVTGPVPGAVKIEFIAGHATAEQVPDNIKSALKLYIGDLYENRQQTIVDARVALQELPRGVPELMSPYQYQLVR